MSKGIKMYKRYVDDVVISMKLDIWHSSFLDVFFWKDLLLGEISTVMKRNGEFPVGHVKKGSCHPEKYKLQSLLGEMLRGRRLASDEDLIGLSDECLAHEFKSLGYSRWEVNDAMEKAKKKVDENYSPSFVRIPDDDYDGRRYFSYGGGLVFNKNYRYGEVVMNYNYYIESIKPHDEPGITLLPDVKIKNLAYTRKRYLARQEESKTDNEI